MTKQQQQAAPAAQPETAEQPSLEPVIAATAARRKSIVQSSAAFMGVDPKRLYDVLRGIWTTTKGTPPLSDAEIWRGLALVARYELDPFAREIYVTRDKKGHLMIILGIDGWVRVLDRTDHYDGFTQEILWKGDQDKIQNAYAVVTRIHSKNRSNPTTYVGYAEEYSRLGGFMASTIPLHMLRLFSLRHAARLFCPLGSCVTEEEARWMGQAAEIDEAPPVNSLDELADRLTEKPEETPDPQAEADLKADRAQLFDEFAGEMALAKTASRVAELVKGIEAAHDAGILAELDYVALTKEAEACKKRLSK